jgi:hypothetical protein
MHTILRAWTAPLIALSLLAAGLGGCDYTVKIGGNGGDGGAVSDGGGGGSDGGTGGTCVGPDGRPIAAGESYYDGCNWCSCQANGLVACTLRACLDDAGAGCIAPDGTPVPPGGSFRNGCNSCYCSPDGQVSCTAEWCADGGPEPPPPTDGGTNGGCYRGGCSGELCTDDPNAVSTCIWRDEFACYRSATCARQADGQCGWTQTPELRACLAGGGSGDGGTVAECRSAADCRLYSDYCGGCNCIALGPNDNPPVCSNPFQCLVDPCEVPSHTAACVNGQCVVQ